MGQDGNIDIRKKPNFIQRGRKGEKLAFKKFTKTPVQEDKYMVVVYKEGIKEGFVITAFLLEGQVK